MNRQPYGTPPRWWEPKLTPWWVRATRRIRWKQLHQSQNIEAIDVKGGEILSELVNAGKGVLITPNHSAHYDSNALYSVADGMNQPLYFMTAWQAFAMSSGFERWAMQHLGCFSIDRESTDRQAFKQAIDILQNKSEPLVIFPEGDIYHMTDVVLPFREGAAAIALSAARRCEREIVVLPVGMKFWYTADPTDELMALMDELEKRVFLRPSRDLNLKPRILRLAEAMLALKEVDYLGQTSSGNLGDRIVGLQNAVLAQLEDHHKTGEETSTPPERVKALRQLIISKKEGRAGPLIEDEMSSGEKDRYLRSLEHDMDDVFFAMQLYSYAGDYLSGSPSIERVAETLDKFEEDILERSLPTPRGRRRLEVRFGEPITVTAQRGRDAVAKLNEQMHSSVQSLIDQANADAQAGLRAAS